MKNLILKILIAIFIIGGTALVIYYAKGYRFSLEDNVVMHTGILHVETEPSRANFYLTENFTGRTPEIVTSIPQGEYTLDIWLDEYHGIEYDLEIFAQRSTPLSVFLFKENPEEEVVEEIEGKVIEIIIDKSRSNSLIFLETEEDEKTRNFEIWRYQTNTRFWQLGKNPAEIFTFSTDLENEVEDIFVSPNSKNVLITITGEEVEEEDILTTGKHLISLDTQTVLANIEDINEELKWSHDGETLIWNSKKGIEKLNLKEPETPTLVYTPPEKTDIIHYDSYTNGEIYILTETEENSYVSLSRVSENLEESFLLEKIHYQNEIRFLEDFREKEHIPYQSFKNSPQSTLFVGKPYEFLLSKENHTIIFNTEFGAYMYDIEEDKYVLINPYKTEIISFSPDGEKISFISLDSEQLGFFRFDKEINNQSIELGGNYLASYINKDECPDFAWHQNSQNIYYICENSLYATDIRAGNNINIVQDFGKYILLENKKKVATILKDDDGVTIVEHTIN